MQLIPFQLNIDASVMMLTEERSDTRVQLKKVQALEHDLERSQCHRTVERVSRSELNMEVVQKENLASDLIEAQATVVALTREVEDLCKHLIGKEMKVQATLLKGKLSATEEKAARGKLSHVYM